MVICFQRFMFPQHYVSTVPFSSGSMFSRPYMHLWLYVPTVPGTFGIYGFMNPEPFLFRVRCSYIPIVLYSQYPMYLWFCVPRVLYLPDWALYSIFPILPLSHVPRTLEIRSSLFPVTVVALCLFPGACVCSVLCSESLVLPSTTSLGCRSGIVWIKFLEELAMCAGAHSPVNGTIGMF